MRDRCASCGRSLAGMQQYRRRSETFRPGSIAPSTPVHQRGRPVLCGECWRELTPHRKGGYAFQDVRARFD